MSHRYLKELGPSLVLALGILASTIAVAADSGWLAGAGVLLLALSIAAADALASRLRGGPSVPSSGAVLLTAAVLLAFAIVAVRDTASIGMLIPILGGGAAVVVLFRTDRERRTCG